MSPNVCEDTFLKATSFSCFFSRNSIIALLESILFCFQLIIISFFPFYSPFTSSWETAFNAIPYICFAFQCHISAVPIYAGLKKRTFTNFFFICTIGVLICTIVYTMAGVFGDITFVHRHDPINSDILRNYCPNDIPVSIARGTLIVSLITSYPILFFCGRYVITYR